MVKKIIKMSFYSLFVALFVISCLTNMGESKNQIAYVNLDSLDIKDQLYEYYEVVLKEADFEFAFGVDHFKEGNHIVIEIYYERNLIKLINHPAPFYSYFEDKIVFIRSKLLKSDSISNTEKVLLNAFPEQYKYFKLNNDVPTPVLYRSYKWIYIDNKFVGKEIK